jgi:putative inorganic carbon (HCO3(-)) transporter
MLGLGLSQYIPYVIYGLSFIVTLLAVFYRSGIGIIFLVPLFPIYVVLDETLKSGLPMANNIPDMIIAGSILGLIIQGGRDEEHSLGPAPQLFPIMLLMSVSLVGFLLGTSYLGDGFADERTVERMADIKNFMIMPVLYIIAYYGLRERKWKYVLFFLLFLTILAADVKFKMNFQWYYQSRYTHDVRGGGTFGFLKSNVWGAFHAIYSLMFLGIFLIDRHRWRRIAYGMLIFGGVYCMLYSYSRGAYVAFAAGLLFITLVRARLLIIPLAGFLLVWKLVLPSSVVDRIEMTFMESADVVSTVAVGETYLYTSGRKEIWDKGMEMFWSSPLIGTGMETFGKVTGKDAHNEYLKMLTETGVLGLLVYLFLYLNALRSGWRLYRDSEEELLRAFGFGFVCAVIGSMVANVFGDRWSYLQIGGIYWVSWGLIDQENSRLKMLRASETAKEQFDSGLLISEKHECDNVQGIPVAEEY